MLDRRVLEEENVAQMLCRTLRRLRREGKLNLVPYDVRAWFTKQEAVARKKPLPRRSWQ